MVAEARVCESPQSINPCAKRCILAVQRKPDGKAPKRWRNAALNLLTER
jgi:hypothetical protein